MNRKETIAKHAVRKAVTASRVMLMSLILLASRSTGMTVQAVNEMQIQSEEIVDKVQQPEIGSEESVMQAQTEDAEKAALTQAGAVQGTALTQVGATQGAALTQADAAQGTALMQVGATQGAALMQADVAQGTTLTQADAAQEAVPMQAGTVQEAVPTQGGIIQEAAPTQEESLVEEMSITMIGDSVMLGAAPSIQEMLPDCVIDAKVSRQVVQAGGVLDSLEQQNALGNTIVIALGTNGPFSIKKGQALIDRLGSGRTIYWVTVYGTNLSWQEDSNATIRALAANNENVRLIEWSQAASKHTEWLCKDGIHLNAEGRAAYTGIVLEGIL